MFSSLGLISISLGLLLGLAPSAPPKQGKPPKSGQQAQKAMQAAQKKAVQHSKALQAARAARTRYLFNHVHFHVAVHAPGARVRTFRSGSEATAFMGRLRRYHFVRHMRTQPNGSVVVNYSGHHWHRVLSTRIYGSAVSHASRLQALGFMTRVTRHVY